MSLLTPKPKPKKAVAAKRARVPMLPVIDDSQLKYRGGRLTMEELDGAYDYLAAAPKKILKEIVQHYNKGQIEDGEYVKAPSTLSREQLVKEIRYVYNLDYSRENAARSGSSGYEWGLGSYTEDEDGDVYENTKDPKGLHEITSKWFYKPPRKKRVSKKKVSKKK